MITKCRFCDYSRDAPVDLVHLAAIPQGGMTNSASYWLEWAEQIVTSQALKDYRSVKVHMGMKHKDKTFKYLAPETIFTDDELVAIGNQKPLDE